MKRVGIIGATGYTGEELLRILARHPEVQVDFATSERENGEPLARVFPNLPHYYNLHFISAQEASKRDVELVFLCLHAGESARWAKVFFDRGIKVIDLGADFRFRNPDEYEKWYGAAHVYPELLQHAVYGLPEWHREEIRGAAIVGNPGCYPTSVLLAVLPLLEADVLADAPVIVDAKSGVSGAGKTPSKVTHYVEVNESIVPYKVGRAHRHVGEMEQEMGIQPGCGGRLIFTPHLTPMTRGILSAIYVRLENDLAEPEVSDVLKNRYAHEPFVHILDGQLPSTALSFYTNHCFISAKKVAETRQAILFSAIDNLGKGASSQAVQNMNLMLGFPETTGLET